LIFFLILPNPAVITSNVTRNYAGNYADFALQVIFKPYLTYMKTVQYSLSAVGRAFLECVLVMLNVNDDDDYHDDRNVWNDEKNKQLRCMKDCGNLRVDVNKIQHQTLCSTVRVITSNAEHKNEYTKH